MDVIFNKFKRFSEMVYFLCKELELPIYNSKFSNKIYSNVQHMFLLVYRAENNFSYREVEESLYDSKIPKYISLRRIPDHSTLQKFAKRLGISFIEMLIRKSARLIKQIGNLAAIDSTGLSLDYASHHYCKRIDRKEPLKGFITLQCLADIENQTICAIRMHKKRMHDSRHLKPLFKKIKSFGFSALITDKSYDSNENHKLLIINNLESLIAIRNYGKKCIPRNNRKYRNLAKARFDFEKYRKRSRIEGIFGVFKRKYGSVLYARTLHTQKVELSLRILAYNINRVIKSVIHFFMELIRVSTNPIIP